MASEVKTNKVSPSTGVTVTLGDASDVFQLPASAEIDIASGATLDVNGTIDVTGATTTGFPSSGLNRQVVYTASTAAGGYSPQADVAKIIVIVQGGGGGGNRHDTDNAYRHGGGGGGYVMKYIASVSSTDTMTVTVGTAGAGATSNNAGGGAGTVSSFASVTGTSFTTLSAGGGAGGSATASVGSAGGTATGGDIDIVGCPTVPTQGENGHGSGNSLLGQGGDPIHSSYTSYPNATGYGAGGAYGHTTTAGNGSAGVVIIQEYK